MKTKLRRFALATMLLSGTSLAMADQRSQTQVGDLMGLGEDAYFSEDGAYVADTPVVSDSSNDAVDSAAEPVEGGPVDWADGREPASTIVGDGPMVGDELYLPVGHYDTASSRLTGSVVSDFATVSHHHASACDGGCDAGCDSGCDSACSTSSRCGLGKFARGNMDVFSIFERMPCDTWSQSETLLWWVQDRQSPSYVSTAPAGTSPAFSNASAVSVFGDPIQGELSAGSRTDMGKWISDNVGIGGRFWYLFDNNDSYYASGNGSNQSIGRPFFNSNTGTEDAILVALNGSFTGEVAATDELKMYGGEAYTRIRFSCAKNARVEFIGGYSHFDIENTLQVISNTVTDATGRNRTYADFIRTENRFNGGQLGFEMIVTRGRWMARSLTKVHLGNMQQSLLMDGFATDVTAPNPPTTTQGGLLTLEDRGAAERDVFAFVPEANFKLGYRVRKNVLLSVGYSFIYWDNIALTGDNVDRVIDGSLINTTVPPTALTINDSSLWVQGIDLGVIVDF